VIYYISDTARVVADLISVVDTTAETLFNNLEQEISTYGLDVKNCIGFAAEGANVMFGGNYSV